MNKETVLEKAKNEKDEMEVYLGLKASNIAALIGLLGSCGLMIFKMYNQLNWYDSYTILLLMEGSRRIYLLKKLEKKEYYIGITMLIAGLASLILFFQKS